MKLLIIGGVAGGASAAAKARRIDENSEIIVFERGDYVSFANCGLPYHIGKVIANRESLLVMTPEKFKVKMNIDVRVKSEVIEINPLSHSVKIKKLDTNEVYEEVYDKLILSTGSTPFKPPIPGSDQGNVMTLWNIADMDKIKSCVDAGISSATVIGAGFIGIEVAENLQLRGVNTNIVEMQEQVFPIADKEMTVPLKNELIDNAINVYTGDSLQEIRHNSENKSMTLILKSGNEIESDLVVLSIGVRPNSELAIKAGLKIGLNKTIQVNEYLQTSDPDIYAVGDAVQINDIVLDIPTVVPLAGPASRQGRIAALNAYGEKNIYRGSQGTFVCKVFDFTFAGTGVTEKRLIKENIEYKKIYLNLASNASYYPGANMMTLKVLFKESGHLLGAQIVGRNGVDKRIDVLATAIRSGLTLRDLEDLELAYAPPYGSAKDPVNFVGFVGNNLLKKETSMVYANSIPESSLILDVREVDEVSLGAITGSINIPLGELRGRILELDKSMHIVVHCQSGTRSYMAERILKSKGFDVSNLSGGYIVWKLFNQKKQNICSINPRDNISEDKKVAAIDNSNTLELNVCGMQCPGPIVAVKKEMDILGVGKKLKVRSTDMGFYRDIQSWCESTGHKVISLEKDKDKGIVEAIIQKKEPIVSEKIESTVIKSPKSTTIVLFSGDLDKALAALILATGFASLGHKVNIFCTFWGLNLLRKDNPPSVKKDIISKMFGFMMPKGAKKLVLSKMNMLGAGTAMMKYVMNNKNVDSLPKLLEQAKEMGVNFLACEMAMNVMGLNIEELIDGVNSAGVANFAVLAEKSTSTLFI